METTTVRKIGKKCQFKNVVFNCLLKKVKKHDGMVNCFVAFSSIYNTWSESGWILTKLGKYLKALERLRICMKTYLHILFDSRIEHPLYVLSYTVAQIFNDKKENT